MYRFIDFQGIITLERPIIGQVIKYLDEMESRLGQMITTAIQPLPMKSLPPVLSTSIENSYRLSEAIEIFSKQIRHIAASQKTLVSPDDHQQAAKNVTHALWEYAEVLEGTMLELFFQLEQVSFEAWSRELGDVVHEIYQILLNHLEEAYWARERLEQLLEEYRRQLTGKGRGLLYRLFDWKGLLDRTLATFLSRCIKELKRQYSKFSGRLQAYLNMQGEVRRSVVKFGRYQMLGKLEEQDRAKIIKIYELLKLRRLNKRDQLLPDREVIRALRGSFTIEAVHRLCTVWYQVLQKELFQRSRNIKKTSSASNEGARKLIVELIEGYQNEAHTLGAIISRYREFYLSSHPNPYVRSRFGFSEWIVGPEPQMTKKLLTVIYDVESLDALLAEFKEAVLAGPKSDESFTLAKLNQRAQRILKEMEQPLTLRSVMHSKAESLIETLSEMRELTSFSFDAVRFVGQGLSQGMRVDWKYHTLFETVGFYKIYHLHLGIAGDLEGVNSFGRQNHFKEMLHELKQWVETHNTHRHVHEIEQDMSDIKSVLQGFLGQVQREAENIKEGEQAKDLCKRISQELLRLRFLFGDFFHLLSRYGMEGKTIRNRFLFVDQYFETVEHLLHSLHVDWRLP